MATFSEILRTYPTIARALKLVFADNTTRAFKTVADYPVTILATVLEMAEDQLMTLTREELDAFCLGDPEEVEIGQQARDVMKDFFDGENSMFLESRVTAKTGMRIKATPVQRDTALAAIQVKDPKAYVMKSKTHAGYHVLVSILTSEQMDEILSSIGFTTSLRRPVTS